MRTTLLARIDECYELVTRAGREIRGVLKMSVLVETRPRLDISLQLEKPEIEDVDFLECVSENPLAIEEHIERLRAQGEKIEGPIRIEVTREMPPPPPSKKDAWPADHESPPCPAGTRVAGTHGVKQWCEETGGVKHGPEYIWDTKKRLVVIMRYEHGEPNNSIRMRDPESD